MKMNPVYDEWEDNSVPEAPASPESLKEAGLSISFINDMILKMIYPNLKTKNTSLSTAIQERIVPKQKSY